MAPAHALQEQFFNDRMSERVAVEHHALIEREGMAAIHLRLTDLSGGGFQGDCAEQVEIGQSCTLNLGPAGSYPVRLLWQLGARLGGEFQVPLSWGGLFAALVAIHTADVGDAGFESAPTPLR